MIFHSRAASRFSSVLLVFFGYAAWRAFPLLADCCATHAYKIRLLMWCHVLLVSCTCVCLDFLAGTEGFCFFRPIAASKMRILLLFVDVGHLLCLVAFPGDTFFSDACKVCDSSLSYVSSTHQIPHMKFEAHLAVLHRREAIG